MTASADRDVLRIAPGYQLSQALYVVAKLGVADALADGPLEPESRAAKVGARPREPARAVRAIVANGP